jgi:alkylhydroperoxidase family enzyme
LESRHAAKIANLRRRVLDQPGALDPAIRKAVAAGVPVTDALDPYVDKVRRHAYRIMDADVESLRAAGYSQDQIFELTVAAALGAATLRLDVGLAAMSGGIEDAST